MSERFRTIRLGILALGGMFLVPFVVHADGDKQACVDSHVTGQRNRKRGALRAARTDFLSCSQQVCPAVLRNECTQWLSEVEQSLPTVILTARDGEGNETVSVRVVVDGEQRLSSLTGTAIEADPGQHTFRFIPPEGPPVDRQVVLHEGDKNVRVEVRFPSRRDRGEPTTSPPSSSPALPASFYLVGGLGVAALGSFGYFGVTALRDGNRLDHGCAPDCSRDEAESVRTHAIVADVSLGVAVVSLGLATAIALWDRPSSKSRSQSAAPWVVRF